jgi:hypothetical protein
VYIHDQIEFKYTPQKRGGGILKTKAMIFHSGEKDDDMVFVR